MLGILFWDAMLLMCSWSLYRMVIVICQQAVLQFGVFLVIAVSSIVPSVSGEQLPSVRSQIRKAASSHITILFKFHHHNHILPEYWNDIFAYCQGGWFAKRAGCPAASHNVLHRSLEIYPDDDTLVSFDEPHVSEDITHHNVDHGP